MKKVYLMSDKERQDVWIGEIWMAIIALESLLKLIL